jgi:DNA-binding transcriptional ArsR family regulator
MVAPSVPAEDLLLTRALGAMASPVRVAILRQLQTPRQLADIAVSTAKAKGTRGATLARQTVKEHLGRLMEAGFVLAFGEEGANGKAVYLLNHQRLYSTLEAFRELARLRPEREIDGPTAKVPTATAPQVAGPALLLLKGLEEGRCFPLPPPGTGERTWVLGRARKAHVSLDFDPFVSLRNARIHCSGGAYSIVDLPESRNGTLVNFRALPKGEPTLLRNGDLIGLGKTLLLFRQPETAGAPASGRQAHRSGPAADAHG